MSKLHQQSHYKPVKHQSVAYTDTAGTIANAIGAHITVVRVVSTSACFIAFGKSPTATAAGIYLPADKVEYFTISGGDKVSAIQATAGGTLHVTEMSQ